MSVTTDLCFGVTGLCRVIPAFVKPTLTIVGLLLVGSCAPVTDDCAPNKGSGTDLVVDTDIGVDTDLVVPKDTDPPLDVDLYGIEHMECFGGVSGCADHEPYFEGTCCAPGDPFVHFSRGPAHEAVDIETDGELVWACGGFGVTINRWTGSTLQPASQAAPRCQRIAPGPTLADGSVVFWLSHHGDSWVSTPNLWGYKITADDVVVPIDDIADSELLFEGLAYRDGWLYVATHAAGLRVYAVDQSTGALSFHVAVDGFENAKQIAIQGDKAYVTDNDGVHVVSLSDPSLPVILATLLTGGTPRDVEAHGDRVYVALGDRGFDVFDVSGDTLDHVVTLDTLGSVQGVGASDQVIAVAAWSHVAIYDPTSFQLLGTEHVNPYPRFEENLGVTVVDDIVFGSEWTGMDAIQYRKGYAAPDLWITEEALSFFGEDPVERPLEVRNVGGIPLEICHTETTSPGYSITEGELTIAPGESGILTVNYLPPVDDGTQLIRIHSDDGDVSQRPFELPIFAIDGDRLDVGDKLNEDFAFLDPTGQNDLSNLEGHVTVLAYFALF